MPLTFLRPGETGVIRRVGGADDTKRFLANLGFVDGSRVSVVSELSGNMIVTVKDARVAINKEMAKHVILQLSAPGVWRRMEDAAKEEKFKRS